MVAGKAWFSSSARVDGVAITYRVARSSFSSDAKQPESIKSRIGAADEGSERGEMSVFAPRCFRHPIVPVAVTSPNRPEGHRSC